LTAAVRELLNVFEGLTDAEKQEAAAEVLRRALPFGRAELPDEVLVSAADELFRELDAREAADARP